MTPDTHGGETTSERLDVMERHLELLIDDLQRLREDLMRDD